jgi:DNA-binding NarL/FixJ family response regulator
VSDRHEPGGSSHRVMVVARSPLLSEAIATVLSADADIDAFTADPTSVCEGLPHADALLVDAVAAAALRERVPGDLPIVVIGERSSDAAGLRPALQVPYHADLATLAGAVRAAAQDEHIPRPVRSRRASRGQRATDRQQTLTPREVEVLRLLASGNSSPDVAVRLEVSEHTVRTHLQNAMAKLDARTKVDAVARARRLGLLGQPAGRREVG